MDLTKIDSCKSAIWNIELQVINDGLNDNCFSTGMLLFETDIFILYIEHKYGL